MSKIYIDPLNLGPILIDTKDFSQCTPWKDNPRYSELGCEAARLENTGKKRPEHSKLMRQYYEQGRIKPPVGMAKGKRSKKSRKNMSDSIAKLRKKIVSCIKCHKPTDGSMFEGAWMCHFANHHRSC